MGADAPDWAELGPHIDTVAREIVAGRVVPFVGAGANLCGRASPVGEWQSGGRNLPSGSELAEYLAKAFGYPEAGPWDLLRVSQFAAVMTGAGPLYEELHLLFDADFDPTSVHRFLASLPGILRTRRLAHPDQGSVRPAQVIITTNYDDTLERGFRDINEPFDLVWYVADKPKEHRGQFMHLPHGGKPIAIDVPNEYPHLSLEERTVILKIHGAIDRSTAEWDSYVITEDHYIDYLTRTDISSLLPAILAAKLKRSHFLFMGYSLSDWNLRVILHRIWGDQPLPYKSWAIQLNPPLIEREFWRARDVDILDVPLDQYIEALRQRIVDAEDRPKAT